MLDSVIVVYQSVVPKQHMLKNRHPQAEKKYSRARRLRAEKNFDSPARLRYLRGPSLKPLAEKRYTKAARRRQRKTLIRYLGSGTCGDQAG